MTLSWAAAIVPRMDERTGILATQELVEDPGAIWELLNFSKRLRESLDTFEKMLEPVLRPNLPSPEAAVQLVAERESPMRGEIRAMNDLLDRFGDLRDRLDL